MRVLFLSLLLLLFKLACSQDYVFKNYSLEEGLIQAYTLDIFQDSYGYLWFGTQSGVSRFDGHDFVTYDTKSGLGGDHIRVIFQDNDNHYWFGHRYEGITFFDGKAFTPYKICSTVENIIQDSLGNILISTFNNGVFITNKESYPDSLHFINITEEDSLSSNAIWDLEIKDRNEIYVLTDKGINILKIKGEKFKVQKNIVLGLGNERVTNLETTGNKELWASTPNQLLKILPGEEEILRYYPRKSFIGDNYINKILSFDDSSIWGLSESGAFQFKDDEFKYFSDYNGLPDHNVSAILKDHEGSIWFATEGHGVSQHIAPQFKVYNKSSGLVDNMVSSIMEDSEENIWIATAKGVSKWDGKEYKHFTADNFLHTNDISVLFQDSKGFIWFGTMNNKGLLRYHPETGQKDVFHSMGNFPLRALTINEDKEGNIWFGSVWGDLYKYTYTSQSSGYFSNVDNEVFGTKTIWTIHKDRNENLWFGCDEAGLIFYDGKNLKAFGKDEGLTSNRIGAITHDKNNNLWIATNGDGVFYFNRQNFRNYSVNDGLSADNPFIIETDESGDVWIGTNTGIDRLNPNTNEVRHYGSSEGFIGIESNQNAVLKDQNGHIWFGTIKGAIKLAPEKIQHKNIPPRAMIQNVQLFHEDFNYLEYADSLDQYTQLPIEMTLPYNKNHLSFHFVGISFLSPEKIRYKYQLQPFDEDWMPLTKAQKATYTNLPPGNYTFKLKAANYTGNWNDSPVIFSFTIGKPFWQETWFIIIAFILALGILYLGHYLRTWKIKHDKKILEGKVKERTSEIVQQKEEITAQRDEIEAQRNYARQQRDEIVRKNLEMTSSIQYAKNIQAAVLPPDKYIESILKNYFILFKPKEIVSGDFYWMLKKGDKTLVAAVDCTGHGIPGAFMSLLGITLLNECVRELDEFNAGDVLNLLRAKVITALHQRGELKKSRDGMDLGLIIFDNNFTKLDYAGAFCPLFIVRDNKVQVVKPDRMPIGIYHKTDQSFSNKEIHLYKGDKLYLLTDGFIDQMNNETRKKFLRTRFKETLSNLSDLPISRQKDSLLRIFNEWKGDYEQIDDVLVIGIEI